MKTKVKIFLTHKSGVPVEHEIQKWLDQESAIIVQANTILLHDYICHIVYYMVTEPQLNSPE